MDEKLKQTIINAFKKMRTKQILMSVFLIVVTLLISGQVAWWFTAIVLLVGLFSLFGGVIMGKRKQELLYILEKNPGQISQVYVQEHHTKFLMITLSRIQRLNIQADGKMYLIAFGKKEETEQLANDIRQHAGLTG